MCTVPIRYFRVVQQQRTSSNLLEPLQCRESKVCRGLSHEFGVVRLYRTFSNCRETRCVGYLYASSGWFNISEPPRTFSNHFSAEIARCVEVFRMLEQRAITSYGRVVTGYTWAITSYGRVVTRYRWAITSYSRVVTSYRWAITSYGREVTS